MTDWYRKPGTPDVGAWWWAIEHRGHPAFYLRALMPGDLAPGRAPAPRHVLGLDGKRSASVACGTCRQVVDGRDLDAVERQTGARGFLEHFRRGVRPWPAATDPATCWECSSPKRQATELVALGRGLDVKVCTDCVSHVRAHARG